MKKCRLSPDAYVQMALQLAHYRVRFLIGGFSFDSYRGFFFLGFWSI